MLSVNATLTPRQGHREGDLVHVVRFESGRRGGEAVALAGRGGVDELGGTDDVRAALAAAAHGERAVFSIKSEGAGVLF